MAKDIIPERGCTADDLLADFESEENLAELTKDLDEDQARELLGNVRDVLGALRAKKNLDICLTERQATSFRGRFNAWVSLKNNKKPKEDIRIPSDYLEAIRILFEDVRNLRLEHRIPSYTELLLMLVSDIQACRLGCEHCLTSPDNCQSRDPDFPVEKVRKRHERLRLQK